MSSVGTAEDDAISEDTELKFFVQHDYGQGVNRYSCTKGEPGSWMAVYLGPKRCLVADYYALRADCCRNGIQKLRHWVLEASVDGADPWVVLREHKGDDSCDKAMGVAAWRLEEGTVRGRAFRSFRIRQTGKNSGGNGYSEDYLNCTGIELYGRLATLTSKAGEDTFQIPE
jgi:hypothetical protein